MCAFCIFYFCIKSLQTVPISIKCYLITKPSFETDLLSSVEVFCIKSLHSRNTDYTELINERRDINTRWFLLPVCVATTLSLPRHKCMKLVTFEVISRL